MIYLGSISESGKRASIKDIATFIGENEHTVGKLLQKLVKSGIIKSIKGPHGGYYITEDQKKESVINIIHAIDGPEVFNKCGLGLSQCSETRPCPFHKDFKPIRDRFRDMCKSKRISELHENVINGLTYLTG